MHALSLTRRGSALVISSIVVITIAGMSIALTNLSIGRFGEQKARQTQVDLLAATESAANEAISWMRLNTATVWPVLQNLTVSTNTGFPATTQSTSAVLVSSSLPSGLPAIFSSLTTGSTASGSGANKEGVRNSCVVTTKIIKVASSATPSLWDGSERFIVFTTAMSGDTSRPDSVRRQRVETIINLIRTTTSGATSTTSSDYPFTRGLFSKIGYQMGGNSRTDSWNSDPELDGTHIGYVAPASYTVGGANSHGDIGSNGVLGTGAYDTSHVHGTATPSANATLPSITYNPPTMASEASMTGSRTIIGLGNDLGTTTTKAANIYRISSINQSNNKTLTIAGSGTVVIYVDGAFNIGSINFAPASTAKLVIFQNDAAGRGCSFNGSASIGDPTDPSRFIFATAFSGTGSNELSLNGSAGFSGVVLAPYAGIRMNGTSEFYGSFVASDFSGNVNGNFGFHYDEGLAGLSWAQTLTNTRSTTYSYDLAPTAWNIRSIGYSSP